MASFLAVDDIVQSSHIQPDFLARRTEGTVRQGHAKRFRHNLGGRGGSQKLASAAGGAACPAAHFGGIILIGVIDNLVPAAKNPHETHPGAETAPLHNSHAPVPDFAAIAGSGGTDSHDHGRHDAKLLRMGLFTALAIAIHNFPEGLATFLAALQSPSLGIAIAVAIALHNIPEGISVSVPIYYATGNRSKAFFYSVLSGLAEPVGAIIAYLLILFFFGNGAGRLSIDNWWTTRRRRSLSPRRGLRLRRGRTRGNSIA